MSWPWSAKILKKEDFIKFITAKAPQRKIDGRFTCRFLRVKHKPFRGNVGPALHPVVIKGRAPLFGEECCFLKEKGGKKGVFWQG